MSPEKRVNDMGLRTFTENLNDGYRKAEELGVLPMRQELLWLALQRTLDQIVERLKQD
jgi:hypothetical protein